MDPVWRKHTKWNRAQYICIMEFLFHSGYLKLHHICHWTILVITLVCSLPSSRTGFVLVSLIYNVVYLVSKVYANSN